MSDLYRDLLLDHARRPRNFRVMADADRTARGHNPSCGDQLTLWLRLDADTIADAAFQGAGCSISLASASMMTDAVKGLTVREARALFEKFHAALAAPEETAEMEGDEEIIAGEALGKLAAFQGVRRFPVRVKCATLPWHTLCAALDGDRAEVNSE